MIMNFSMMRKKFLFKEANFYCYCFIMIASIALRNIN